MPTYPSQNNLVETLSDLLITGAQKIEQLVNPQTGQLEPTVVVDFKKIGYSTQIINSNRFGDYIFELEKLHGIALNLSASMPLERAELMLKDVEALVEAHLYGISAKSSETLRDVKNPQNNLLQLVGKQQSMYIKDDEEIPKNFLSGIMKKKDQE